MRAGAIVICLALSGTAHAKPITLICNGSMTADGKQINVSSETAILDLDKQSFKPPLYPVDYPLTRIAENDVSETTRFGEVWIEYRAV